MFPRFSVVFIFPLLSAVDAFAPTVTVTCVVGPSYTFALTDGSTTGVMFIDGQCAAQPTDASGSYTFDAAACSSGTVPALGTDFKLVVQEYSTFNLGSDYIVMVNCTLDTSSVTQDVSIGATGNDDVNDTATGTVTPTFSIAFKIGGAAITSGTIGESAEIYLSIPSAEAAVFDYQITTLAVEAGGYTVNMISARCTQYSSIMPQPGVQVDGALTIGFSLFIPKDTSSSPSLPGSSSTSVTFTFTIEVCASSCPPPTCGDGTGRRKRSASFTNSTFEPVELAASLIVYPPGHKSVTNRSSEDEEVVLDNVCLARTPFIGLLVGLSVALVVCMGISAWMFCRLRRSVHKGRLSTFTNEGYKS